MHFFRSLSPTSIQSRRDNARNDEVTKEDSRQHSLFLLLGLQRFVPSLQILCCSRSTSPLKIMRRTFRLVGSVSRIRCKSLQQRRMMFLTGLGPSQNKYGCSYHSLAHIDKTRISFSPSFQSRVMYARDLTCCSDNFSPSFENSSNHFFCESHRVFFGGFAKACSRDRSGFADSRIRFRKSAISYQVR